MKFTLTLLLLSLLGAYFQQTSSHTTFKIVRRGSITDLDDNPQNVGTNEVDGDQSIPSDTLIYQIENAETVGAEANDPTYNEVVQEDTEVLDPVVEEPAVAQPEVVNEVTEGAKPVSNISPSQPSSTEPLNVDDQNPINKYCKCTEDHCDCCRNFALPIIPVRGPGCARISYLGNEKMSVQIKYGDIILASRTVSGKNTKPICVGLPGGYSKFCGKIYGLSKVKDNFKACLGLELRAADEVEAALRVSCFKFGPGGLKVAEAEPFPVPPKDEDDYDDFFGFGGGDDDDADEEDEEGEEEEETGEADDETDADDATDTDDYGEAAADDATDSEYEDVGGFAAELFDDDDDDEEEDDEESSDVVSAPPSASRKDPEIAEDIGEISTANPKSKKSKKKKDVDDEGFIYEMLQGLVNYFS